MSKGLFSDLVWHYQPITPEQKRDNKITEAWINEIRELARRYDLDLKYEVSRKFNSEQINDMIVAGVL